MTDRPRRLLLLLNSLAAAGAESFVLQHVRHADRSRFEPIVCQFGGSEALLPRFREAGVEVVNLREGKRPDLRTWARLAVLLRRRRIDVLQAHIGYSCVVARIVGRIVPGPVVVTTGQTMPWQWGKGTRRLMDVTVRLPHANVFISRADFKAQAERHPFLERTEPVIIPNGIDVAALRAASEGKRGEVRRELGLSDEQFAFGIVARLDEFKGHDTLIEAFARVATAHAGARLFMIGTGPLEGSLRELVRARGLEGRATFLGVRMDVPRLLSGLDAYVHTAKAEALGIAVLEALAVRVPTIGAAVDGVAEFVREGDTGFTFPPGDAAALAERMTWIATRPAGVDEVARRGQERVARDYDIHGAIRKYEALYDGLLASRRA